MIYLLKFCFIYLLYCTYKCRLNCNSKEEKIVSVSVKLNCLPHVPCAVTLRTLCFVYRVHLKCSIYLSPYANSIFLGGINRLLLTRETQNDLCTVQLEFMDSVRMSFTLPYFNPRYEMGLTSIDCSNMILKCHSDSVISNSSVIQKTRFKIQIFRDSVKCVWVVRFVATPRGEREQGQDFAVHLRDRQPCLSAVCATVYLDCQCYTGTL